MSGGQPPIRGYLIQTLIALLDALANDRPWDYVRFEPADPDLEKIDLLWEQAPGTRAVQVKSSQNQISKADAERWAEELAAHHGGADELELVLVGPCAESVVQLGRAGRVTIPPPVPLNLGLLCQAAAHRLARAPNLSCNMLRNGTSMTYPNLSFLCFAVTAKRGNDR